MSDFFELRIVSFTFQVPLYPTKTKDLSLSVTLSHYLFCRATDLWSGEPWVNEYDGDFSK